MSEAKQITAYDRFQADLRKRELEIQSLLPTHIPIERFLNTVLIAVKNNSDLLTADPRSLHAAVTRAAEDGLNPDGREGVINIYNEKKKFKDEKGRWQERWVKTCCWIPMVYGIRKRAKELCGMLVDAQVVHAADHFEWIQGDEPRIIHRPTPLDGKPGKRIGVYAIFKKDDIILHREVMRASDVEDVKSMVKAQNGLLWTKFENEAWRKTVIRRGIKTVPSVPDTLARIIERDDEQYSFRDELPAVDEIPQIPDAQSEDPPQVLTIDAPPDQLPQILIDKVADADNKTDLDEVLKSFQAIQAHVEKDTREEFEQAYAQKRVELYGSDKSEKPPVKKQPANATIEIPEELL